MSQPLWRWLAPLLILLLAALLRLHQLGTQSLWNDEGNSVVQALRSLDEIAQHAARDIHPPGYYWLLHGWSRLTGSSEFALRHFSALASLLGVACLYAAGRWLYGRAAGLAAALFLALNGFSIWYAQETRMYALLALWGSAAVLALAATLTRPRRGPALALALINAAGLWTHYAWPYVLLAQGLVLLLWLAGTGLRSAATWHRLIAFIAAMGLALLLFLPWLPTALERVTSWPGTGVPVAMESALGEIFGRLAVGSSYHSLSTDWQLLAAMAALILVLAGLWPGRGPLWRSWLPLVWTLAPLALFLALGLYREANLKFLLPAQAGFALWAGRGCWWLTTRTRALPRVLALAAAAILASGMALALAPLGHEPAYQRADYRALVADISVGLGAQDLIVLNAPNQREVFDYYYRGTAPLLPMPPGTGPVDEESLAQLREGVAGARRIFALYWGETERDPQRIVERSLVELTYVAGSSWYGDVRLARYSVPQSIMLILRTEANARFGEHITLLRHDRSAQRLQPGDWLLLPLVWRADTALQTRYKVFLHLLDAQGRLVAQHDSEPGGGLAPTTAWTPGARVLDRRALILPDQLPQGSYTLIVGLYTGDDPGQRLRVGDADHLVLGTLEISGESD